MQNSGRQLQVLLALLEFWQNTVNASKGNHRRQLVYYRDPKSQSTFSSEVQPVLRNRSHAVISSRQQDVDQSRDISRLYLPTGGIERLQLLPRTNMQTVDYFLSKPAVPVNQRRHFYSINQLYTILISGRNCVYQRAWFIFQNLLFFYFSKAFHKKRPPSPPFQLVNKFPVY